MNPPLTRKLTNPTRKIEKDQGNPLVKKFLKSKIRKTESGLRQCKSKD